MQPPNSLILILRVLSTEAVHRCTQGPKLCVMVAIGTGLRRATTRTWDGVPRFRAAKRLLIGPTTRMRPVLQYAPRWISRAATRYQKASTDSALAGVVGG